MRAIRERLFASGKARLVPLFIVVYLLVQTVVPLIQLFTTTITPSGWGMYSYLLRDDRYTVTFADSRREVIDGKAYVGAYLQWIDWPRTLPPHLCRVLPDAVVISVEDRRGRESEYVCR